MMYSEQYRINRKLTITKLKEEDKDLLLKVKEYDLCKQLIRCFIDKQFARISFVHGGYKNVHKLCIDYSISILNHEADDCKLCNVEERVGSHSHSVSSLSKSYKLKKIIELDEKPHNQNKGFFDKLIGIIIPRNKVKPISLEISKNNKENQLMSSKTYEKRNSIKENHKPQQDQQVKYKHKDHDYSSYNKQISINSQSLLNNDDDSNSVLVNASDILIELKKDSILSDNDVKAIIFDTSCNSFNAKSVTIKEDNMNITNSEILIAYIVKDQILALISISELKNVVFEIIEVSKITDIITKKANKSIVNIHYKKQITKTATIELFSDTDSKALISHLKKNIVVFV